MTREAVRLLWHTITSCWRRKSTPEEPRPGSDEQWPGMPHLIDRVNDSDQADDDGRRSRP
jgi:hypothetical protein